ncbi:uncharacterized protein LOC135082984 [Ostrinia nubilalis]|uniref:uncharacterized protein LOC135082984 n=1 Tax=Ostrinia nubilalis TaxID=29057 RepID=UPI0030824986
MSHKLDIGKSEYLLFNTVDEEAKKFFRPLDLLQTIFFFSKYTIRDNFITHKSLTFITLCIAKQEKRMHKNIIRLSKTTLKMAPCNLFAIDATTPRRLLSLIATYTIVLLQFALLK